MKEIDADELKQNLLRFPCQQWVYEGVCRVIDEMAALNEQPEILYQTMIPLNPRVKKNSQQIRVNKKTGKKFIGQSDIYKQYESDCGWFLKPPARPIETPVNIECIFYRDSARKCDLTNLLEAIDDILVKYKIIADDNFTVLVSHDGSKVFIDRINPRTEIKITRAKNYTELGPLFTERKGRIV